MFRETNLIITITNTTQYTPGLTANYTVTVFNKGPSDSIAGEINLQSFIDPVLINVYWLCSATGGSFCDGPSASTGGVISFNINPVSL